MDHSTLRVVIHITATRDYAPISCEADMIGADKLLVLRQAHRLQAGARSANLRFVDSSYVQKTDVGYKFFDAECDCEAEEVRSGWT